MKTRTKSGFKKTKFISKIKILGAAVGDELSRFFRAVNIARATKVVFVPNYFLRS
jgi:hypothetical protein